MMTQKLLEFLDASTCNFIAAKNIGDELELAGFEALDMRDAWELEVGGKYYVKKNNTAIFAFIIGSNPTAGYKIIAAHSDSPGFRIKPNCEIWCENGMLKLNTEVFGGPILYTWFDRPLSLSGRVMLRSEDVLNPQCKLVDFKRPLLVIPHLAIHYNRSVNEGNPLSKQTDMLPILAIDPDAKNSKGYFNRLIAKELEVEEHNILDYELSLYPVCNATLVGLHGELICSPRIDDLEMAYSALAAISSPQQVDAPNKMTRIMAIFDNEETGSGTKQGAASPVLKTIIKRINRALGGNDEDYARAIANSFLISADNGHSLHPNYISKQDPTNHPIIGNGPVIKYNANCKYMTDADSAAVFRRICERADVPVQTFVNHSDVAGGSTLGNILTSQLDIRGVDMGAPQWAMHSCCETAGTADFEYIVKAFTEFYRL